MIVLGTDYLPRTAKLTLPTDTDPSGGETLFSLVAELVDTIDEKQLMNGLIIKFTNTSFGRSVFLNMETLSQSTDNKPTTSDGTPDEEKQQKNIKGYLFRERYVSSSFLFSSLVFF